MITHRTKALTASWRNQHISVQVIRLWLGITWVYGGWYKAVDPGFLSKTGTTSFARELVGFQTSSPLGFVFKRMLEHSTFFGVGVILIEFALGFATLFWVAPTLAAFAGFSMSLGLWLTATWHVKPYFLGSDTVYAVMWLSYLLVLIGNRRRVDISLDRRSAMRVGSLAGVSVLAAILARVFQKRSTGSALSTNASSTSTSAPSGAIVKVADLPIGKNFEFALGTGEPVMLFRTKNGVFAYSEICTHQGCTVQYSAPDKTLMCPCHGATYDPFNGAKVLSGPATTPLASIKVAISGDWVVLA
jgi:thiosulfate dehydrogenase (quinone) large subunit